MLWIKVIIVIMLALILLSLVASMFTLMRDRDNSNRTAKFLTFRIVMSILLFILIGVSFYMGWIQPHGLIPPQG